MNASEIANYKEMTVAEKKKANKGGAVREQIANNEARRKMDQGREFSYADWGPAES